MIPIRDTLETRRLLGRDVFLPRGLEPDPPSEADREIEVGLFELLSAFKSVLDNAKPEETIHEVEVEVITVRERMIFVMERLEAAESLEFMQVFTDEVGGLPSRPLLVRVMTLTTAPIASLPQSALCGPRTISMRSTWPVARYSQRNSSPVAGSLARTPSINTSTWLASEPRTRTWVCDPIPPVCEIAKPGTERRTSVTYRAWRRSMSLRVTIVVALATRFRLIGVRAPVTMIWSIELSVASSVSAACDAAANRPPDSSKALEIIFIVVPCRSPRFCVVVPALRGGGH